MRYFFVADRTKSFNNSNEIEHSREMNFRDWLIENNKKLVRSWDIGQPTVMFVCIEVLKINSIRNHCVAVGSTKEVETMWTSFKATSTRVELSAVCWKIYFLRRNPSLGLRVKTRGADFATFFPTVFVLESRSDWLSWLNFISSCSALTFFVYQKRE